MPLKPTTKAQVDGHRFLLRRARHAVVGRDVRMLHDPLRRQSTGLVVGLAVTAIVCAGAAILAFLRPAPDINRAQIMVASNSGALFVRSGDRVHPVLNLASARLVLGTPEAPKIVKDSDIAATDRGGLLGIPGAPSALPPRLDDDQASAMRWTICDSGTGTASTGAAGSVKPGETSVIVDSVEKSEADKAGVGPDEAGRADSAVTATGPQQAILASYAGQGWLLANGSRAAVDLGDSALLEVLGLREAVPRGVGVAVLDALPESSPLERPTIPHLGEPVNYGLSGIRVGQILTVTTTSATQTFVALSDGIQQVGSVVADVIRSTSTVGDVLSLTPDQMSVPRSTLLNVDAFPQGRPQVLSEAEYPVVCARSITDPAFSGRKSVLLAGSGVPATRALTPTAANDGSGNAVDAVSIPGGGIVVAPTARGADTRPRNGPVTILSDTGVRFDVPDAATAQALGIGGTPVPVDGGTLQRLPAGPALTRAAALIMHDGIEPDAAGVRFVEGNQVAEFGN